jgi:uncharacterized phage-associated protein
VLVNYGNNSASSLSKWSHQEGSPWDKLKKKNAKYGDALED